MKIPFLNYENYADYMAKNYGEKNTEDMDKRGLLKDFEDMANRVGCR